MSASAAPKRAWRVVSTCWSPPRLLLYCPLTRATGIVRNPTPDEWLAALSAHDDWPVWSAGDDRVELLAVDPAVRP